MIASCCNNALLSLMGCIRYLVKVRRRRNRSETSGGDRFTSVVAPRADRYSRSPKVSEVLYKVENGKRTDLPLIGKGRTYGMKEKVPSGVWGTLRVVANGDLFEVYHNDKKLYEVKDETFKEAGKIGLWTKADSVIYF